MWLRAPKTGAGERIAITTHKDSELKLLNRVIASIASALLAASVYAQTYPTKPLRLVVGWPPGGAADGVARPLALKLSDALGRPVVVENRPGATGTIGATLVAKAPPDGYTLLLASSNEMVLSPYEKMPYDPVEDFAPVSLVIAFPSVLVVHPSLPVKSVKDLIAMAKAKPGQLLYASTGNGGSPHLATEMFKQQANIDITHIPYKGTPPAVTDLIAGQVSMMFANTLSVLPYVNSGRLRALAISSIKRSAAAPSLPTIAESGMPGFDSVTWFGLLAPTGVPREAINRLNPELRRIVQSKALADLLIAQGADPIGSSAEECAARFKADIAKCTVIIKTAGVRAE